MVRLNGMILDFAATAEFRMIGLTIYLCSFLGAACVLYLCVERPFLRLRDRMLGVRLKTS
jgi:peptidoglycan/LPS O-acetylase OafA/YrhL